MDKPSSDEEVDLVPSPEAQEASGLVEVPTLLMLGQGGDLHLLYEGAISCGSVKLGEDVDIISASISTVVHKPKTPFNPASHSLQLSVLASVETGKASNYPPVIAAALSERLSSAGTVLHLNIEVPHLPSREISALARASTAINQLLGHAFEAFDEARKGWEEVRNMGKKWLNRLTDDSTSLLPEMQLLALLLTGRPTNTSMHEYFASKNTERVR